MSTYRSVLPQIFPFVAQVREDFLPKYLYELNRSTIDAVNGSSYAVTSDAPLGYRYLWLSDASRRTIENLPDWTFTVERTN